MAGMDQDFGRLRLLATSTTAVLHDIARDLAKERRIKSFCSSLAAGLSNVTEYLKNLDDRLAEASVEREWQKLLDLLPKLDELCQWPRRHQPETESDKYVHPRQFRNLSRLLEQTKSAKRAIFNLAKKGQAGKYRTKLLNSLKAFDKPGNPDHGPSFSELSDIQRNQQSHDDYDFYLRQLYAALSSYCVCRQESTPTHITANLRLKEFCRARDDADSVEFRLFFLDHPHQQHVDGTSRWQDAKIRVTRKRNVGFQTNHPCSQSKPAFEKLISLNDFCRIISNRHQSQIGMAVAPDGLLLNAYGSPTRGFQLSSSSISLAELLRTSKLSPKLRLLLSYFLAKAVCQFLSCDWMQQNWTKETIHFMWNDVPGGLFVNDPFFSTAFGRFAESQSGDSVDPFRSHPLPNILALGILILEIELGIDINGDRTADGSVDYDCELPLNDSHIKAMEVSGRVDLWEEMETYDILKTVVKDCLEPTKFVDHTKNPERLRDALEEHVVKPLRILYRDAWDDPDTSQVRPAQMQGETIAPIQASKLSSSNSKCNPIAFPLSDSTMSSTPETSSDTWFEEMGKLNLALRGKPGEKDAQSQPAKIAILDTGVNMIYADLIKQYKDFTKSNDTKDACQDDTGHGTNAVLLVLKIYNVAALYVGRVFESSEANANTVHLMSKAIVHATREWKVDIIVIPSGFQAFNQALSDAVDQANHARILIFSAAANHANLAEITYPGRYYATNKVFCMFSTDAKIRCLPGFNPSPLKHAKYNFAILGENVSLHAGDDGQTRLSGTSYATMIGGALAGRIIDFSRHRDGRERIRRRQWLTTVEGMSAIFAKMAKKDSQCHCLVPWRLLLPVTQDDDGGGGGEVGIDTGARRRAERNYICETISRALEEIHT